MDIFFKTHACLAIIIITIIIKVVIYVSELFICTHSLIHLLWKYANTIHIAKTNEWMQSNEKNDDLFSDVAKRKNTSLSFLFFFFTKLYSKTDVVHIWTRWTYINWANKIIYLRSYTGNHEKTYYYNTVKQKKFIFFYK